MNNTCASIITYNPDIRRLQLNISSVIFQVNLIIIIDNGSSNIEEIEKLIIDNYDSSKFVLLENKKNLGIAKALNQACQKAIQLNYEWILTLDQDSISPSDLVEKLYMQIEKEVAIVAPNIQYENNDNEDNIDDTIVTEVDWVITSASLTNLNIWKQLNGFDELLFIDGIDRDYCIRANKNGYRVLLVKGVRLVHRLGDMRCKKVFGKTIHVTYHTPKRKYYMTRNVIYLDKKLSEHRSIIYVSKLIMKTMVYEPHKIRNIRYIFKGIKDGIHMRERL